MVRGTVYVFPLKIKDGQHQVIVPVSDLKAKEEYQERKAKRQSDNELKKRAKFAPKKLERGRY